MINFWNEILDISLDVNIKLVMTENSFILNHSTEKVGTYIGPRTRFLVLFRPKIPED